MVWYVIVFQFCHFDARHKAAHRHIWKTKPQCSTFIYPHAMMKSCLWFQSKLNAKEEKNEMAKKKANCCHATPRHTHAFFCRFFSPSLLKRCSFKILQTKQINSHCSYAYVIRCSFIIMITKNSIYNEWVFAGRQAGRQAQRIGKDFACTYKFNIYVNCIHS